MKVLIISHNPITTYQNMGKTLLSLFSAFQKHELCQLYCYPSVPDIDVCNSYYRITDKDALRSVLTCSRVRAKIIRSGDVKPTHRTIYESPADADFYKKYKKNALTLLLRDAVWSLSRWFNHDLEAWLEEERPTSIFLAPGESKFIYNIALSIAKRLDIGIVTYVCDEYYFVQEPKGRTARIQLILLKRRMKAIMTQSRGIVTICQELSEAYHAEFGTDTHVILTGASFPIAEQPKSNNEIKSITYMGNLTFNRYKSIAEIGAVLDALNRKHGTQYQLRIYAAPFKEAVQEAFSEIESIRYCGYVTGDDFLKILLGSEVLLHTEAFDEASAESVKHSVSTKIADALSSGVPLFAYGPKEIASMQHLIRNQCAVIVTDREELEDTLLHLLGNASHEQTVQRALATARKYHVAQKNSSVLYEIMKCNET